MDVYNWLVDHIGKGDPLRLWFTLFLGVGLIAAISSGWLKARKIQPKGFKWKTLRNEVFFGALNVLLSGAVIAWLIKWSTSHTTFLTGTPSWWMIAIEYAAYFFLFDTWFYWLHRWMHREPVYTWVHKLHHWSTAPNLMTNFSVNPLESLINGGFVPLFLLIVPVHQEAFALITPTNVFMGLWIHSGYELFPRWWNKSWATKWFITTTFHDQHHKYFTVNFGGYTTIWDRICGTMRPKYESDFVKIKDRAREARAKAGAVPAEAIAAE